jgi:hypothetical protein
LWNIILYLDYFEPINWTVFYHETVSYGSLLINLSVFSSVIFFLIYLLSHSISRKLRQALILLCEIHFALLYILQINLVSSALEKKGSVSMEIVMQLGMRWI